MVKTRALHLTGMVLWRGGLLYVAAYGLYRGFRELTRWVELPRQLEIGVALGLTGLALVIASLITERIEDAKAEGDLSE